MFSIVYKNSRLIKINKCYNVLVTDEIGGLSLEQDNNENENKIQEENPKEKFEIRRQIICQIEFRVLPSDFLFLSFIWFLLFGSWFFPSDLPIRI